MVQFAQMKRDQSHTTSWEKSGKWYNALVGQRGHYYHEHTVLPGAMRLLNLQKNSRLLDVGCGQGVLARRLPKDIQYVGLDTARSLIEAAKKNDHNPKHSYLVADVTKPFPVNDVYSHIAAILSLQNMEQVDQVIQHAANRLIKGGRFLIVLNHPAFRIPRQSGWGIGENKLQYRYVNRYMSPLKVPINMHPGAKTGETTWSFHQPISFYTTELHKNGFMIETIEEWTSDKVSEGKVAKMENRARNEIPLFMAIVAVKH